MPSYISEDQREHQPPVSIVVPVANGEDTIRTLLESLLNLDYPKDKMEIIIVDGNSVDRTRQIVSEYPVKLLAEAKKGPNPARNLGLKHATGEIIMFTDCDCVVPRDWVKSTVINFSQLETGCVGGNVRRFKDDFLSRYSDNSIFPLFRRRKERKELDSAGPMTGCPVGCNMAFRREALASVGGFDSDIRYGFEEDELVIRICRSGYRLVLDPKVLVWHRHRSSLRALLGQVFKYGKGAGRLLKRPKNKTLFKRWLLIDTLALTQIVTATVFLAFLASQALWRMVSVAFLAAGLSPFSVLMIVYVYRSKRSREYRNIVIYPSIDLLRVFAFCLGELFGFFQNRDA